jgi:hypothetical protein
VQESQEVAADGVIVGLGVDALAVVAVVVPVEQHRAHRGHQPVGDALRARLGVVVLLRLDRAQHRNPGAQHIHRVRLLRHPLQRGLERLR